MFPAGSGRLNGARARRAVGTLARRSTRARARRARGVLCGCGRRERGLEGVVFDSASRQETSIRAG